MRMASDDERTCMESVASATIFVIQTRCLNRICRIFAINHSALMKESRSFTRLGDAFPDLVMIEDETTKERIEQRNHLEKLTLKQNHEWPALS